MIRVNLLPVRKSRRRSQGRTQLILFAGVIILEIALLGAAYIYIADELSGHQEEVERLEERVETLEEDAEGLEDMKDDVRSLAQQLEAIQELDDQRIGPVQVLDDLQAMLSPYDDDDPFVADLIERWRNPEWEPRRLWLERFEETGEGGFSLEGRAGDGDDVAEFLARTTMSVYFDNVELDYVQREGGSADLVSFQLDGDLDYTGFEDPDADDES